jgi:serine/threonine-protein kinase
MTRRRAVALGLIALLAAGLAVWALTRSQPVNVPAVIEQPLAEARALLERRGFEVSVATVAACAPEDTVVEQDPRAGSEAEEGSRVILTVSLGLAVKVPPVRGLTLAQARKRLADADLLVATREQASREIAAGRVISSDPPGGEEVECQSQVTLLISKGANLITLPDVLGQSQEIAQSELERLGFIVDVDTKNEDEPEGTVIGQDPGPGSRLLRGDRVTIIVSTGAGSVIVPGVEGQSEQSAISTLQSRGLSVDVIRQETEESSEDGRVLEQAPDAGTRVLAGDTVTITVGDFVAPIEIQPPTTEVP